MFSISIAPGSISQNIVPTLPDNRCTQGVCVRDIVWGSVWGSVLCCVVACSSVLCGGYRGVRLATHPLLFQPFWGVCKRNR